MTLRLEHLGMSGLRLVHGRSAVRIDAPEPSPTPEPLIVTWSEAERVAGVRPGPLAARPEILSWLGQRGVPLRPDVAQSFCGLTVSTLSYRPIPYATPPEAVRKVMIGLRRPRFAARRLAHTLKRPPTLPIALRITLGPWQIALLQQALHRFVDEEERARLHVFAAGCDVAVASPDFEDEAACGALLGALDVRCRVLVDAIGPVRRRLGLPTRPLARSLETAPPDTVLVEEDGAVDLAFAAPAAPGRPSARRDEVRGVRYAIDTKAAASVR